jgi:DNA-binding transcriptional regulator PaaX
MSTHTKPKWKTVLLDWKALTPAERVVALVLLARSGKDGWAKMSLGQLRKDSGVRDNRTVKNAIARLQVLGALQIGQCDEKSKALYRLHDSTQVRL